VHGDLMPTVSRPGQKPEQKAECQTHAHSPCDRRLLPFRRYLDTSGYNTCPSPKARSERPDLCTDFLCLLTNPLYPTGNS
jgi:hypothetical protein